MISLHFTPSRSSLGVNAAHLPHQNVKLTQARLRKARDWGDPSPHTAASASVGDLSAPQPEQSRGIHWVPRGLWRIAQPMDYAGRKAVQTPSQGTSLRESDPQQELLKQP